MVNGMTICPVNKTWACQDFVNACPVNKTWACQDFVNAKGFAPLDPSQSRTLRLQRTKRVRSLSFSPILAFSFVLAIGYVAALAPEARAEADTIPFASAFSDSELTAPWDGSAEHVLDGNDATFFSSSISGTPVNTEGWFLSAHFPADTVSKSVNAVRLYPRYQDGMALAFPLRYELMVTNADNTDWVSVGTYCAQPTGPDAVTITFPTSYDTHGVLVRPLEFGFDNYDAPYFQLAKIEASSNSSETPSTDCE